MSNSIYVGRHLKDDGLVTALYDSNTKKFDFSCGTCAKRIKDSEIGFKRDAYKKMAEAKLKENN